ncbi:MAG: phenylalanine--tRNA ligase subunit beta [Candidatus Portnoybacteria bacterium]|nr:phenylalanine--tRNA ligase subunit beta [Candidatus Portnoybacteria bacterium]
MKVSYNWLQSFLTKKLPSPEKLADLLSSHSFETEVIERVGSDYALDVDVLPNRAHDCLGHLGVAREIGAILGMKVSNSSVIASPAKQSSIAMNDEIAASRTPRNDRVKDFLKIKVGDKKLCPRYTARMVVDVKVGPSPEWIQERLKVCGLKPINNIVDTVNYVMLETGQPMHAFDFDKIAGEPKTLIIRRAKKGEKIISLDNETYELDENILVIADEKSPLCIAGMKGGKDAEIDKETKRIVLEAANFDSRIIRKAFNQLKLRTDASWRFENGLDPNSTSSAMDMAVALIDGQILKGVVDIYPNKVKPKTIKLDAKKVRSLLGVNISDKEIVAILKKLGFEIKNKFQVTVPTCRLDISIQEDLIEEIGRLYGFEKIPSRLPLAALIPPKRNDDLIYQNKIKDILVNLGFSEALNYSLIGDAEIELANPISQEQKYLRPSLALNLLKNIESNKRYFNEVRLFEIGRVFERDNNKVIEKKKLGAALFPSDFYRLKGIIETLLNKMQISDVWYEDELEGDNLKRAKVKVGNDLLGWIGDNIFELDFEKIVELATEERIYSPPSKYPAVVRDVALLVEPGTKIVEVMNLINTAGGSLISDVDLFDMYEGEEIPDGKKSLAFRVIYQADDHTLTDKEVNALQEKVMKALEDEGGWEVRKQK